MITGSCLCRGIRFEVTGPLGMVAMCHCEDCRKANGTAYSTNAPVRRADVSLTCGEDLLASYESSPGEYRMFCSRCGSPIFSRRDDKPDTLRLRLGTLDGDPGVRPAVHGWIGDKAAWDRIPNDGIPRFASGAAESRQPRVKLTVEEPGSADAKALISALDAHLSRSYPPHAMFGLHDGDHNPERMVFLVGRMSGNAVACGALRSLDAATGEIKRMFVVPELRGAGIARTFGRSPRDRQPLAGGARSLPVERLPRDPEVRRVRERRVQRLLRKAAVENRVWVSGERDFGLALAPVADDLALAVDGVLGHFVEEAVELVGADLVGHGARNRRKRIVR
jgi:hypothetical protein